MPILSQQEIDRFRTDGYLILDTGLPEPVLDGIVSDLDGKYPDGVNRDGVLPPTRVQDAWKFSENVRRLATAPRVMDALRELYGREALPFQTLNFPTGTLQPAHSDALHFNSCPAGYMCGVWVALEDCDEANGAIEYYAGSHLLPEFNMADVGVPALEENYAEYEEFIVQVIERFGLERDTANLKKGQALIWTSSLIHAGGRRDDLFRSRHSQVTHVFFENCSYYTPMKSRGLDVCWRNPEFIPKTATARGRRQVG